MPKFRKKPVVITAIKNDGTWATIREWIFNECGWSPTIGQIPPITRNDDGSLNIATLEGTHLGNVGDYIICGVKGEFYPCKPDIFESTYESAENES